MMIPKPCPPSSKFIYVLGQGAEEESAFNADNAALVFFAASATYFNESYHPLWAYAIREQSGELNHLTWGQAPPLFSENDLPSRRDAQNLAMISALSSFLDEKENFPYENFYIYGFENKSITETLGQMRTHLPGLHFLDSHQAVKLRLEGFSYEGIDYLRNNLNKVSASLFKESLLEHQLQSHPQVAQIKEPSTPKQTLPLLVGACDGSAPRNRSSAACAWVLSDGRTGFKTVKSSDCWSAEIEGLISVLEEVDPRQKLILLLDSKATLLLAKKIQLYGAERATEGKSIRIAKQAKRLEVALARPNLTLRWVKGHAGKFLNDQADRLALAASRYHGKLYLEEHVLELSKKIREEILSSAFDEEDA